MKVVKILYLLTALLCQNSFADDVLEVGQQEDARIAIQAAAQAYAAAFNARDAEKLSLLWSEQAVYTLPGTGEQLIGRESIRKMFADRFSEKEPTELSITVHSIRFVTDNVAVETGTSRLVESSGEVSRTKYSAINVKQNGQWLLDSVTDSEVDEILSSESPLSQLDWMVGQWEDASNESTIKTICNWTMNKRFLTRNFTVEAPGTDKLEGTQIIGWDPVANAVRSWVFDSDGGFSEGTWTNKGESWVVESAGFTADGQSVSSIQVFSSINTDDFHWQSFGRKVGDDRLPDIAEVTVIRKK